MGQMDVSQNGIHGGRHGETNPNLLGDVMGIFHLIHIMSENGGQPQFVANKHQ